MRKLPVIAMAFGLAFGALPLVANAATPLSLDTAVALGLKQNLEYARSLAHVDAIAAQFRQARAPKAPSLALEDTYQYVNPVAALSTPMGAIPFSTVNATNVPLLALQYTLFDGGATAARASAAAAGLSAAEASAQEARGATIARVSKAYYDLAAALQLQSVAERGVAVAQAHERDARTMLAAGTIPRADLLRAQAELASERVNAIQADNGVDLARVALDSVLDVPLDTVYAPTDPLDAPPPRVALASLLVSAHSARGELAAARFAVDAARHAITAARAGGVPQVKATIADGNTQPAVVGGYHNQFSLGLSAVWTLFDNGYTAGRVAEADAGLHDAQLSLAQMQNGVDVEVREAYLNLNEAAARVEAARDLVTYSDENLRLAQVRYRGGVGTALELQDAELRDRTAQQTLTQSEAALRQSVVQLRYVAGLL